MPAAALTPSLRYFPPGTRQMSFVPTMANYLAPTRAELNSGTELSGQLSAMTGWSVVANMVDTPDLGSKFTTQVSGRLTSGPNDLTLYLSSNSIDGRNLLTRGTTGNIVLFLEGDIPGQKMTVFPVTVTSQAPDTATENPATMTFSFAVTKVPAENVTIPA